MIVFTLGSIQAIADVQLLKNAHRTTIVVGWSCTRQNSYAKVNVKAEKRIAQKIRFALGLIENDTKDLVLFFCGPSRMWAFCVSTSASAMAIVWQSTVAIIIENYRTIDTNPIGPANADDFYDMRLTIGHRRFQHELHGHGHSHLHPFAFAALCFYFAFDVVGSFCYKSHTNFMTTQTANVCVSSIFANTIFAHFHFASARVHAFLLSVKAIYTIPLDERTHNYKCIDFMLSSSSDLVSLWMLLLLAFTWRMAMRTIAIDFPLCVCMCISLYACVMCVGCKIYAPFSR